MTSMKEFSRSSPRTAAFFLILCPTFPHMLRLVGQYHRPIARSKKRRKLKVLFFFLNQKRKGLTEKEKAKEQVGSEREKSLSLCLSLSLALSLSLSLSFSRGKGGGGLFIATQAHPAWSLYSARRVNTIPFSVQCTPVRYKNGREIKIN